MIKELHDKEWLKERYIKRQMTMQQIADEVGCNKTSVSKALRRNGIDSRRHSSKYPKLNDKEWLRKAYEDDMRSVNDIANEIGTTPGNIVSHLETLGIKRRSSSEGLRLRFPKGRNGKYHPHWKGGRRKGRNGYIWIHNPNHSKANSAGYIQEHRLIAESLLDRPLSSNEIVHHIDGDKTNNNLDNLEVMSRGDHFRLHYNSYQRMKELEEENKMLRAEIERLRNK